MGHLATVVDTSTPDAIAGAIQKVQKTPGLRSDHGLKALWIVCQSPGHRIRRSDLEKKIGGLDLHFGWFCRRVAEELGDAAPDVFALVNYETDGAGSQVLAVKPCVLAAMPRAARE